METPTRHGVGVVSLVWRPLTLGVVAGCAALLLSAGSASAQPGYILDHFMCYTISGTTVNATVQLEDQFDMVPMLATVAKPVFFCNPTRKVHGEIEIPVRHPNAHLEWYTLITTAAPPRRTVVVSNQFNPPTGAFQTLTVSQARWLAVPTQKDGLPKPVPEELDHFKCYAATGRAVNAIVSLEDQFEWEKAVTVLKPVRFCNPVTKFHGPIISPRLHPEDHLVCYDAARQVKTSNQFTLSTISPTFYVRKMSLCVPSQKISWK